MARVSALAGALMLIGAVPSVARAEPPEDVATDGPGERPSNETVRVAVPPFRGPKGAACAQQVAESLRDDLQVVRLPRLRPPADRSFQPLAKWLSAAHDSRDASERPEIWLVGRILPGKVFVEVYEADKNRLLGVARFWPSRKRGCRLPSAIKARIIGWSTRGPITTPKSVRALRPAGSRTSGTRVP